MTVIPSRLSHSRSDRIAPKSGGSVLRRELDRELARSAHGAFRPYDITGQRKARNALQPFLHRHGDFQAGEVRADTAVDPEAESRMPVLLAVDDHLVGIRKHRRIAVRRREG